MQDSELIPANEPARLAAVGRYDILDTPPDGTFDRITSLAARLFDVPIAIVSIVDEDRIWFKSHHGLDAGQTDRERGLCASAILQVDPYVVREAHTDARAMANPLVAGELGLRFYAAAQLTTPDGYNIGTLCVLDVEARDVTDHELETLRDLAAVVIDEMELRRTARDLHHKEQRLLEEARAFAGALQQSLLPAELPDVPGIELAAFFHPADVREVSGDFYDVFAVREGLWGIAIGDVAGKGPSAAAATSLVRYSLRTAVLSTETAEEAFSSVNRTMLASEHFGRAREASYCTLVLALLDTGGSGGPSVTIARAGHVRPLIVTVDGAVRQSKADGQPLGLLRSPQFVTEMLPLRPGESVILYTDGLTEARIGATRFGASRLSDSIGSLAGCGAIATVDHIRELTAELASGIEDDVAVVVINRPE